MKSTDARQRRQGGIALQRVTAGKSEFRDQVSHVLVSPDLDLGLSDQVPLSDGECRIASRHGKPGPDQRISNKKAVDFTRGCGENHGLNLYCFEVRSVGFWRS